MVLGKKPTETAIDRFRKTTGGIGPGQSDLSGAGEFVFSDSETSAPSVDPAEISRRNREKSSAAGTSTDGRDEEQVQKRRGRKPGSRNREKSQTLDLNGIERLLFSIHIGVAALTRIPEIAIDDSEAKALSQAVGNVARHYDVPILHEKYADWINLAMVMAGVYGPRFAVLRMRRSGIVPPRTPQQATPQPPQHKPPHFEPAHESVAAQVKPQARPAPPAHGYVHKQDFPEPPEAAPRNIGIM